MESVLSARAIDAECCVENCFQAFVADRFTAGCTRAVAAFIDTCERRLNAAGLGHSGIAQALEHFVPFGFGCPLLLIAAVGLAQFHVDLLGFRQQCRESSFELCPNGVQVRHHAGPGNLKTDSEL